MIPSPTPLVFPGGGSTAPASGRQRALALGAILLLAGVLRFPAIHFGNGHRQLARDEGTTARLVQTLLTHPGYDTRNYKWPNVNVYASAAVIAGWQATAQWLGADPGDYWTLGRGWVAASGVLTVLFLYLAALRLTSHGVALLAAGFLAVMPLHIERSRVWLTDAPMTMFYTLTLWLAARALERPTLARMALTGAAAGLATGTKYNGVIACVLPALVALATLRGGRAGRVAIAWRLAVAGLLAPTFFLLGNPYTLDSLDLVRRHLGIIGGIYTSEPPGGFLGYYVTRTMAMVMVEWGVGVPLSVLAVVGVAVLVWRRTPESLLVWLPPVLFVLVFCSSLRYPLERNFLPTLPHVALAAATALITLLQRLEHWASGYWPRVRLVRPLAAGVLLALVPAGVADAFAAIQSDTRLEAAEWIDQHVPLGARISAEFPMIDLPRSHYEVVSQIHPIFESNFATLVEGVDYIVVTSLWFQSTLDQRDRPGFAARAEFYDALFDGHSFALAARFAPNLHTYGPEVRVYRNLHSRWPKVEADRCFDLRGSGAIVGSWHWRFLRSGEPLGAKNDFWVGAAVLPRAGRWELRISAETADPEFALEVQLGNRARRHWVRGPTRITHEAPLAAGEQWFRIATSHGQADGITAWLTGLELCPAEGVLQPGAVCASSGDAGGLPELGLHGAERTWRLERSALELAPDRIVALGLHPDGWAEVDHKVLVVVRNPAMLPYWPSVELGGHAGSTYPLKVVFDDGLQELELQVTGTRPQRFELPLQPAGTTTTYDVRCDCGFTATTDDTRGLSFQVTPARVESLGTGVRGIDITEDGWTGAGRPAALQLTNPRLVRPVVPVLEIRSLAPEVVYPFTVFIDQADRRLEHVVAVPGMTRVRLNPLPQRDRAVVFVSTDKTWQPGGNDPRTLGVLLSLAWDYGD